MQYKNTTNGLKPGMGYIKSSPKITILMSDWSFRLSLSGYTQSAISLQQSDAYCNTCAKMAEPTVSAPSSGVMIVNTIQNNYVCVQFGFSTYCTQTLYSIIATPNFVW